MGHKHFISAFLKQAGICEFKPSLDYLVSCKIGRSVCVCVCVLVNTHALMLGSKLFNQQ